MPIRLYSLIYVLHMCSYVLISSFFFPVSTHIGDVCICVSICKYSKEYRSPASGTDCRRPYMYSCACSLSSNPIDLCTVITCELWQDGGRTALLLASERGHADTVRVLVELGASVEAVDKVNIHAHALANTCACVQQYMPLLSLYSASLNAARPY